MLLELMENSITLEGKQRVKNLRFYVPREKHKFRLSFDFIKSNGTDRPMDIIGFMPVIDKNLKSLSVVIKLEGVEKVKDIPFNIDIIYSLSTQEYLLDGMVGNKRIRKNINSLCGVIAIIQELDNI